jgi:hypothetical protein
MTDHRVELFHSKICQILEPLSPVYIYLRDMKSSRTVPLETLNLIKKRLNLKALSFARTLADYIKMKDSNIHNYSNDLLEKSDEEAERLWTLITFLEIDNIIMNRIEVLENNI